MTRKPCWVSSFLPLLLSKHPISQKGFPYEQYVPAKICFVDDVPSINEYTWTVNPYCDDCDVPDLPDTFRLYIVNTADSSARFYSPEFRISEVAVSSSISSAALPTLSGSSTTISIRTATVSIGPMPSTSSAEPSPSVAPLKIGLGVGLGVGIPLLLLVGILICLGLRRKKATYVSNSRTLQKQKNKSTSLSKDDNPYGIAVQ